MTEVELCSAIKASNLFPGFKLHEEVGISSVSCDMVFENGTEVYTVEAKMEFNFKVVAQALRWQRVVTASFIAVPLKKARDVTKVQVLEALGIGLIVVYEDGACFAPHHNVFASTRWNATHIYKFPADLAFWKECFERIPDATAPAGSQHGDRSTTFTRTIAALKLEAEKHPDYNLKQLLVLVPTHYASVTSAASCIRRYAEHGIIEKFWHD